MTESHRYDKYTYKHKMDGVSYFQKETKKKQRAAWSNKRKTTLKDNAKQLV